MKLFIHVFLSLFLVLLVLSSFWGTFDGFVFAESPPLVVVIGSDTVWTTAVSPYILTGPLLVSEGATLTIGAGVTVDFNGYHMRVDGVLIAKGSNAQKIHFTNGEKIDFTSTSVGWNEQTNSGNLIEYSVIDFPVNCTGVAIKVTNSVINGELTVGDFSRISDNTILGRTFLSTTGLPYALYATSSCVVTNNVINGTQATGQAFAAVYTYCYAVTVWNLSVISGNNITGSVVAKGSSEVLNNNIVGDVQCWSATVSGNNITGKIKGVSCTVSNNAISGGQPTYDWGGRSDDPSSAVSISGYSSVVENNFISSPLGGYGILIQEGDTAVSGNVIFDCITGIRAAGDATIAGNLIKNNGLGIAIGNIAFSGFNDHNYGSGDVIIRDNTITNNGNGISGGNGGSATIERNSITNCTQGIYVLLPVIIQNNTISGTQVAVVVGYCSSITLIYNNIENYTQNSIWLKTSNNLNASYNWWGTTDTQTINQSIFDFKNDFNLGTVNFTSFLDEPNPEAELVSQPTIPEFSSWIILPLLMVLVLIAVVSRKKLMHNVGPFLSVFRFS
ncbi:MAG: right-handed parallel beta-helix repeat-containing protein [Candidatus Bathyarchaeia archaeon]